MEHVCWFDGQGCCIYADCPMEGDECQHPECEWAEFPGEPRRLCCTNCGEDLTDALYV
jgi:hypothetical protein